MAVRAWRGRRSPQLLPGSTEALNDAWGELTEGKDETHEGNPRAWDALKYLWRLLRLRKHKKKKRGAGSSGICLFAASQALE